jgi:hypothetical protein
MSEKVIVRSKQGAKMKENRQEVKLSDFGVMTLQNVVWCPNQ